MIEVLKFGINAHRSGKLGEADACYTAVLKINPMHPDANHNLGVLAVDIGKISQAIPFFKKALEINPGASQFWLSYIGALIKLGRFDEANLALDDAKKILMKKMFLTMWR